MSQAGAPEGSIDVRIRDRIIVATYKGEMTMALVQDAAERIQALLPPQGKAKLLYDTREMREPGWDLTRWMLNFNRVIEAQLAKAVTVAPDMMIKAHAKAAFVGSEKHEFFSDYDEALRWLKS